LFQLILLIILLIFSAIFSGSEVALFSLDKKRLKSLNNNRLTTKYIKELTDSPRRLLVTILLGNTFFNVAASIVSVALALSYAEAHNISVDLALIIQIILLTLLVLLFGEITPKIWASKIPLTFAKIVSIPLYWTGIILYPITKILANSLQLVFSRVGKRNKESAIHTSELAHLADLGVEKGMIEEDEQELIHSIVNYGTTTAKEIMTPRVDITAISVGSTFDELMKTITKSGHSRIPLYGENVDEILGIIYAKDLLPFIKSEEGRKSFSLKKLARPAMFVPETKLINQLLQEFKAKKMHVGIVVDEYGGTAGLISLEDILEEIVGEIRDEFDKEEKEITKITNDKFIVLGKTSIDDLNELLETDFKNEDDDYETVGGFIFNQAGEIPEKGFNFVYNGYKFKVNSINNKRIESVIIERVKTEESK